MRVHGAFVSRRRRSAPRRQYLRARASPNYIEGILEGGTLDGEPRRAAGGGGGDGESDPMYDQAVAIVLQHKRASISLVQRHLRIGYKPRGAAAGTNGERR